MASVIRFFHKNYYKLLGPYWFTNQWTVSEWFQELNFDKCHVIRYGSFIRPSYFFDQSKTRPVQFTDEERDLGRGDLLPL